MRVKLVVRKIGEEWCLFASDGNRRLGCHPTKEAAEAQERAIKADTGRAAAGDPVSLGRVLVALGADAVISEMGCEGVGAHWDAWGGTFEGCVSAMTGKVDDVDAFCGAFDHAARQCGMEEPSGAGRRGDAMVSLFDSRMDLETMEAEELPDGSARVEVRLAPVKDKGFINGKTEFSIGSEKAQQAVANFAKRGAPVPVTIGHYTDEERQHQPAVAWIEKLYRSVVDGQEYLMATMRYLRETWQDVRNDRFKFLSMEFWRDDVDQHGAPIGFNVDGAAITNYAFFPLRFDQRRRRGESILWLGRYGAGGSMTTKTVELTAGTEIRQVGSEWFIFNSAGAKLGKGYASKETAEAALKEMVAAAKSPPAGGAGDKEEVDRVELARLRSESEALKVLKAGGGKGGEDDPNVVALRKEVDDLKKGREEDLKRLNAQRIRTAVTTLTKDFSVHVRLGDHKIETDEGALAFLATKPFGIESVEGLEKLATDIESSSHLPRVQLGNERGGGGLPGATGELDLETKEGRSDAVRRRVTALRKEFPTDELEAHLRHRGQTVEQFARQELATEHPKVDWSKD